MGVSNRSRRSQSNGPDARIKWEQSLYQEASLKVVDFLIKDLNLLKTRKHLFGKTLSEQLMPCIATVMQCADRLDVPELRQVTRLMRCMYGRDLNPPPDKELLDKLDPRPPTEQELTLYGEKVLQMLKSTHKGKSGSCASHGTHLEAATERSATAVGKRTDLDDLLERIQALRS
ncbi:hypothetical protein BgAZ_107690 [Babesia gibsoni]|uniref:Uncharacterized protein n=1 Tax=Babesia gibsoni TaxID=33632 RepID=A0AAD8PG61_BABGI|nr:hypothetical protein BgAZ_107690 [Babesia gibsoni]